jgi:hypothetical protein
MALPYRPARKNPFARLISYLSFSYLSFRARAEVGLSEAGSSELDFADGSVFGVSDGKPVALAICLPRVVPGLAVGATGSGA